jgi:uncharacterized protein YggE
MTMCRTRRRRRFTIALAALLLAVASARAPAQHSGTLGGRSVAPPPFGPPRLACDEAGAFIRIEGSCELRVPADGLRVVFAITSEAASASECWKAQRARRDDFLDALAKAGFSADAVEVDYIGMLPVFDWKRDERDGQSILVERAVAQRLQENVHVAVADEAEARRVIELALDHDVSDVIAVDYWCRQADAKRREALAAALAEARSKADLLLAPFETRPKCANVEEETKLLSPRELYRSFENAYEGELRTPWNDNVPNVARVHAPRPKNTFFEGFRGDVDRGAAGSAMRPEISVVSTVVLYFESPAHARTPTSAKAARRPL